jgi:predicted  nucleic acid-binding Zn-ribbon protein
MSNPIEAVSLASASSLDLVRMQLEQQRLDDEADQIKAAKLQRSLSDYQHELQRAAEDEKKQEEAAMALVRNRAG